MPEHTIPEELIQNIKSGKVALVVGAGLGIPSWKQLIEGMNEELRHRGEAGDEAAAKDIDKLLSKSSFVRAASFLARSLGRDACDRHVEKLWVTPDPLPEVATVIGQLPFRQVWTTFPGDVLERAMEESLPEGWATPRVLTYQHAADINRQRTVLKLFGDFETFVVTPTSIRQTVTRSEALLDHVRSYYREGSLILVGFRYGDPDLAALLDRVFGSFEPPVGGSQQHYMIASGVGPVTVDELRAEHHIELINLAGRGADEKATAALIRLLEELGERCRDEGITLANARPDADDLEGWLEILGQDPFDADALDAISAIEARAETNEDWDALIDVLMARVEIEGTGPGRAGLLRSVASVFEERVGDLPRAFTALTAALGEDPSDPSSVDEAERLAGETDAWTELVTDVSAIAAEIEDKEVAAGYWVRLGRWYHQKLDHLDYATASYRQALKLDENRADVHAGLAQVYRVSQRWTELADALAVQFDLETDENTQVEIALELGEIRENNLTAISKAIDAYEKAVELEPACESALVALERLYRREERWGKLAANLEARAELFERQGESGRATSARHELATLRAEKLGDLEGAIAKYEAAIEANSDDVEALRSLGSLYEKTGRTPDYLRTLERLAEAVPASERTSVLRRLGVELEERPEGTERALDAYRQLLEIDPSADDAHRAVIRMNAAAENWTGLADAITTHIGYLGDENLRAEAHARLGTVYEDRENDPHRAIEAHLNAVAQIEDHKPSLTALARLYERTESWQRAVDVLKRHASLPNLEGPVAAKLWAQAGKLASVELEDGDLAERYLEKALEVEAGNASALSQLAELHKQRGNWASAISRLTDAARGSSNRLERVELLSEAAELAAIRLEEPEQAAELCLRVLELDPENRDAGVHAATFLLREQRDEDALAVVEMLARTSDSSDRREVATWEAELGALSQRLGHHDKAAKHLRRAVETDSDNQVAALGLAAVLFDRAEEASDKTGDDTNNTEMWEDVNAVYRELLARHRATLADSQVATGWVRIGKSSTKLGDLARARDAFARALEREPANLEALGSVVEIETKAGRWDRVADAKRSMLEAVDSDRKIELLEEIGDLYSEEDGDQQRALGAYLEAVNLAPSSHKLLHKTLDIYTALEDWRNAVETLNQIAATASAAERRAAYFYAAGVIGRDKLENADIAAEHFSKAVDEMPEHPKAFAALDAMLEKKGDYKNLARAYRKRLKQSVDAPTQGLSVPLDFAQVPGGQYVPRGFGEFFALHDPAIFRGREKRQVGFAGVVLTGGDGIVDEPTSVQDLYAFRSCLPVVQKGVDRIGFGVFKAGPGQTRLHAQHMSLSRACFGIEIGVRHGPLYGLPSGLPLAGLLEERGKVIWDILRQGRACEQDAGHKTEGISLGSVPIHGSTISQPEAHSRAIPAFRGLCAGCTALL